MASFLFFATPRGGAGAAPDTSANLNKKNQQVVSFPIQKVGSTPQKSNIDTKNGHILKESNFSKPSFGVSMLVFGDVSKFEPTFFGSPKVGRQKVSNRKPVRRFCH